MLGSVGEAGLAGVGEEVMGEMDAGGVTATDATMSALMRAYRLA